ncbi:MAG: hypothetical protein WCG27_11640, partial [Pseudomonadota bacterium]
MENCKKYALLASFWLMTCPALLSAQDSSSSDLPADMLGAPPVELTPGDATPAASAEEEKSSTPAPEKTPEKTTEELPPGPAETAAPTPGSGDEP